MSICFGRPAAFACLLATSWGCLGSSGDVVREGFVTTDSASLYYRVEGLGKGSDTIVVLHGGPGLHSGYLIQPLASLARAHTLIFYDQRGRGRSIPLPPSSPLTATLDVEDLERVRGFFGLTRMTLVAHHWGAAVAALYAKKHPEHVARMLLISPSFPRLKYHFYAGLGAHRRETMEAYAQAVRQGQDSTDPTAFCQRFWGYAFSPLEETEPSVVKRLAPEVCDAPPLALRRMQQVNAEVVGSLGSFNFQDTLQAIRVPTLVVQGDGDPYVREAARAWSVWMPQSRLLMLDPPMLFPWLGDGRRFQQATSQFVNGEWPWGARQPTEILGPVNTSQPPPVQ